VTASTALGRLCPPHAGGGCGQSADKRSRGWFPRSGNQPLTCHYVVGVAGFEPTASSSRTRKGLPADLPASVKLLVRPLASVGLRVSEGFFSTRSSPMISPHALQSFAGVILFAGVRARSSSHPCRWAGSSSATSPSGCCAWRVRQHRPRSAPPRQTSLSSDRVPELLFHDAITLLLRQATVPTCRRLDHCAWLEGHGSATRPDPPHAPGREAARGRG
jgi:hypothetical protein